ncbi:Uncharacterized membrane protein YsdA, DUF1294 family [Hafnia alvei]|uniref:Uncharacterized membrane protein YsdA, DUF1294 family n=2 Tax=Hafnia alvei TaxID=569 RepID=A0A1C6Z0Y9_HAFAL|nr:Uncharacterized membrane protein YsdA, DUF1294 family [Hafnia alvei]
MLRRGPLYARFHNSFQSVYRMNLNRFCYLLLALAAVGSLFSLHPFVMWCLLLNALTLIIYGIDKLAAIKSWQRVPEITLLFFGLIGGWVGAILGQQIFRHKTQKQPFKTYFIITVMVNLAVTIGAMYWVYQYGIGVQW